MTPLLISVVIPTFQRRDIVCATVTSLAHQEAHDVYEVIVVVDGSTDGTAEALRALKVTFPLTIIEQPNQGLAAARNAGAAGASGQVILFIDDDMEAHPGLLAEHARCHREGAEVVLGHFPLHPAAPQNLLTALVKHWVDTRVQYLATTATRELTEQHLYDLHAAQLSVRREVFEAVGGFNARFTAGGSFGNEDYDFGYRLVRGGYRIVFSADAITWQNYVVGPREYLNRARQAGQSDVAFARTYPEQQQTLFELRAIRRKIHPFLRRPIQIPWLSAFIRATLRGLALMLFRWGHRPGRFGLRIKALFFQVETLEYWTGVRDAGDIPAQHRVRVLCYSHVADPSGGAIGDRSVTARRFREQLSLLRRAGYHFIDAREFIALIEGRGNVPANPVLVTVDDAVKSIGAAFPILRELHVPAVAFVNGREIVEGATVNSGGAGIRSLPFDDAQLTLLNTTQIEAGCQLPPQGAAIKDRGGDAGVREEIRRNIARLQEVGATTRLLAYPRNEEHDDRIQKAAAAEGLRAAFTRTPRLVGAGDNRYQIGRLEVRQSDRGRDFLKRLDSMRPAPPALSEAHAVPRSPVTPEHSIRDHTVTTTET